MNDADRIIGYFILPIMIFQFVWIHCNYMVIKKYFNNHDFKLLTITRKFKGPQLKLKLLST